MKVKNKKWLKFMQIVYDILSFGLLVFVIAAMFVSPPKSDVQCSDNEVVETKARDNLVDDYGWLIIQPYELLSRAEFLDSISDYLSSHTGSSTISSLPPYYCDNVYYLTWSNVDFDNPDRSVTNYGSPLSSITTQWEYSGSYGGYNRVEIWRFNFNFENGMGFTYRTQMVYVDSVSNGRLASDTLVDLISSTQGADASFYLLCRSSSYLASNVFNRSDEYDLGYNQGYKIGYDKGLEDGKDEGYNKAVIDITNPNSTTYQYIYDLGKQEGIVEGMRGTESNAFVVIGQAFSAVGSIFSIEVLPNLPLWVLVFTPLIIVVVIVVVKLIKG